MKLLEIITTIMLLGASNTFEAVPGEEPIWGERLAQHFPQHEIINFGVPGATAWHWSRWVVFFKLDFEGLVVIELGTNDARIGTYAANPTKLPTTPGEYEAEMRWIIAWILSHGGERVMLMTSPPLGEENTPEAHTLMIAYAQIVETLCEELDDVDCGPDLLSLIDVEMDIWDDGIHYTKSGSQEVDRHLHRAIKELTVQ